MARRDRDGIGQFFRAIAELTRPAAILSEATFPSDAAPTAPEENLIS
jgi:hypothetical protein